MHLGKLTLQQTCAPLSLSHSLMHAALQQQSKLSLAAVRCLLELSFVVPLNDYLKCWSTAAVASAIKK